MLNMILNYLYHYIILYIFKFINRLFYLLALYIFLLFMCKINKQFTNVDFLLNSLISKSPTETKLNLKYSDSDNASSLTLDPGGPIINIFFSIYF